MLTGGPTGVREKASEGSSVERRAGSKGRAGRHSTAKCVLVHATGALPGPACCLLVLPSQCSSLGDIVVEGQWPPRLAGVQTLPESQG